MSAILLVETSLSLNNTLMSHTLGQVVREKSKNFFQENNYVSHTAC